MTQMIEREICPSFDDCIGEERETKRDHFAWNEGERERVALTVTQS